MSTVASAPNRLWVQVMPSCKAPVRTAEALAIAPAFVVDLVASGVGAIVKSAADRLIASDQYVIKTVLAYEPSFVMRAQATTVSFLLNCITLNVGPGPIPIRDEETKRPLPVDIIMRSAAYEQSPAVIRLEFEESTDGTALAARVTHWKYTRFLDPSTPWFRNPLRKITIEVNFSDAAASALLTTAMQVEADSSTLPRARPNDGERLPWLPKPVRNLPGDRQPGSDQFFGPVNIEAKITEVAEPSWFARLLGSTLGSQQAAIEGFVKDRLVKALDETEAAKAGLTTLQDAMAARADYESAYKAAVQTRKTLETAADDAAKIAAEQALALQLATLRLKETLARDAFDRAGLPFEPLPAIE
jgi:hypothetical protein